MPFEKPQGMIRPYNSKLDFIFRLTDSLIIIFSLYVIVVSNGIFWGLQYIIVAAFASILFYIFGQTFNLYISLRSIPLEKLIIPLITTWIMSVFFILISIYFTQLSALYSRFVFGLWFSCTPILLFSSRFVLKLLLSYARKRGFNSRKVAIVGNDKQGIDLAKIILKTPSLGLNIIGFFDNRSTRRDGSGESDFTVPLIGNIDDLSLLAEKNNVDVVYIAISLKGQDTIIKIINKLRNSTVSVYLVPDFFAFDMLHSFWSNVGTIPILSILESPFLEIEGWIKRLEDVVLSLIILIIISLPMIIISILIKCTSPGDIIFKQKRYGMNGQIIKVWKFRTMIDSEGDKIVQAKKKDKRVTKFGAFLRRTSLDELPQFFNVLLGEMSIVGPRPHAVIHNEQYRSLIPGYMTRHKVPPGITGWAQIHGFRGETDTLNKMENRVEYDLWYIRNWSLFLDIKIILKTVFYGFKGPNAY